jgi:hypothetical protein
LHTLLTVVVELRGKQDTTPSRLPQSLRPQFLHTMQLPGSKVEDQSGKLLGGRGLEQGAGGLRTAGKKPDQLGGDKSSPK